MNLFIDNNNYKEIFWSNSNQANKIEELMNLTAEKE
jgi:hypothetical protein